MAALKSPKNLLLTTAFLLGSIAVSVLTGRQFLSKHSPDQIVPGPGLMRQTLLSAYFPPLEKTAGDTPVFVFEGEQAGGNILIVGGTHPNEPAGTLTAVLLIENIRVHAGRVILIPWANHSGFTHNDPFEAGAQRYSISIPGGKRWFSYGSRLTNPVHQWPDPTVYVNPGGQKLAGTESRNLNRCYPGRENGTLTERIAFAIMEVLKKENIDLALDLHEAAPEYPVINAIVFHEKSAEIASIAYMELQFKDLEFRLEASPSNLRGLSHREWGDFTSAKAVLLETANASQGRLKGKSTASLITKGKDKYYVRAGNLERLFVPFPETGIPLKVRVARHLASAQALLAALVEEDPSLETSIDGWPSADRIKSEGIGVYLHPLK